MDGSAPGLMERLLGCRHAATRQPGQGGALARLKDAVARDLEDLLNTRAALPETLLAAYPECAASIVNYGLVDFAGLCLGSSEDRSRICASLKAAIERHEPRLRQVQARIEPHAGSVNRVDFIISGVLALSPASTFPASTCPAFEPVSFDAVLQPSTLHYSIHHRVRGAPA